MISRAFFNDAASAQAAATAAVASVKATLLAASKGDATVSAGSAGPSATPVVTTTTLAVQQIPPNALPSTAPAMYRVMQQVTCMDGRAEKIVQVMPAPTPAVGTTIVNLVGAPIDVFAKVLREPDGRWSVTVYSNPLGT